MAKQQKKQTPAWFKLDLSANVYPTLQRRNFSSVFRLSVTLTEPIDADLLQKAVEQTMPRFPTFAVMMRKGVFWRYLEKNPNPGPFVQEDIKNPCMPMPFKNKGRYLIRIYYYNCKISLESFHSLSDGNGAMVLLQTLTAVYLRLKEYPIEVGGLVYDINETPDSEEYEDAYMRYANSKIHPPRTQERAYRLRGTPEPFYTLNIIDGIMPADKVAAVAKSYQATITEYLNSVLIYALLQQQYSENPLFLRPVKLAMPVNLRRFFPSRTLRNFITMVYPTIDPRYGEYTFEEIIKQVHHYMQFYLNDKFLNADISTNAATQQNPIIRIVPLFIKDFVVKQFYTRVQDKQSSAGLTNMGVITVPDSMKPYVMQFDAIMGQPFSARTNCAILSYNNRLTINFASAIKETNVERLFFNKLVQDGIPVRIESNRE